MKTNKHIDIVSFDIPYPANYGGIIDVYNRAVALKNDGWEVTLHCFEYNRPKQSELEQSFTVYYYRRDTSIWRQFSPTPYITRSRFNRQLLERLVQAKGIILLEGLHACAYLKWLPKRCFVRTHNVEHDYYKSLAENASGVSKIYYLLEAHKLQVFENQLTKAKGILAISERDYHYFAKKYDSVYLIPPVVLNDCHGQDTEPYILFSGNLSVPENQRAVDWILNEIVPNHPELTFKIAGRNPSDSLSERIHTSNVELIKNPNENQMRQLQEQARVHLLYSPQSTGLKLKLLDAMACSGHVVCNSAFDVVPGIKEVVTVMDDAFEINSCLPSLVDEAPSTEHLEKRHHFLQNTFGEKEIVRQLNQVFRST